MNGETILESGIGQVGSRDAWKDSYSFDLIKIEVNYDQIVEAVISECNLAFHNGYIKWPHFQAMEVGKAEVSVDILVLPGMMTETDMYLYIKSKGMEPEGLFAQLALLQQHPTLISKEPLFSLERHKNIVGCKMYPALCRQKEDVRLELLCYEKDWPAGTRILVSPNQ